MTDTSHHHAGHGHAHHHGAHDSASPGKALDPVCGMTVDRQTTPHRHNHHGESYFFCSAGCRTRFAADPHKYLSPKPQAPAGPTPEGTIYTCPMHPEVRQLGPGSCPICGMALEPLLPEATEDDSELRKVRRKFWISLAL